MSQNNWDPCPFSPGNFTTSTSLRTWLSSRGQNYRFANGNAGDGLGTQLRV